MTCAKVRELLSAYHDGESAGDVRALVAEHLHGCPDCTRELAGFEELSVAAAALSTPVPPARIWSDIEQQLDRRLETRPADKMRPWALTAPRLVAFAATLLVAVTVGWFAYQTWFPHEEHGQFAAEFGHYLAEFRRDPDAAQQILLTKYEGQLVDPEQAIERVGSRPAIAGGLPDGYTVESTHIMKMPCCTCVQTLCKRSDGSTLAIFEHDDEVNARVGDRPGIRCRCNGRGCCLVELDDRIAASWQRGTRHITLIGVRDRTEVSQLVASFDEQQQWTPN